MLARDGIYRSDDAAASWTKISADLGTRVGFGVLLVDPTTPARLYLTAGANGLHRSNDSGATWTRVKTGFVGDVAMHPSSPAILYAGVDGDGVYRTATGGAAGDTDWEKLPGLPSSGFAGVTLALCLAVPDTIYAGLTGHPFRVYGTTDGRTFALRYTAVLDLQSLAQRRSGRPVDRLPAQSVLLALHRWRRELRRNER